MALNKSRCSGVTACLVKSDWKAGNPGCVAVKDQLSLGSQIMTVQKLKFYVKMLNYSGHFLQPPIMFTNKDFRDIILSRLDFLKTKMNSAELLKSSPSV